MQAIQGSLTAILERVRFKHRLNKGDHNAQ